MAPSTPQLPSQSSQRRGSHGIKALPQQTISQIKSTVEINSLPEVVIELLKNSLDADASEIIIKVGLEQGTCIVLDDGHGFSPLFLRNPRAFEQPFQTSRSGVVGKHGYRGCFLRALRASSMLKIESSMIGNRSTCVLSCHWGKNLHTRTYLDDDLIRPHQTSGTRISVHDLFGRHPVRLKQRSAFREGTDAYKNAMRDLVRTAAKILSARTRMVSVTIQGAKQEKWLTFTPATQNFIPPNPASSGQALTRLPQDLLKLLLAGTAATVTKFSRWVQVSGTVGSLSIRGMICLDPTSSPRCQTICFGVVLIEDILGPYSQFHSQINGLFRRSAFGTIEAQGALSSEEMLRRRKDRRFAQEGLSGLQTKSQKGVNRWPQFYLQISKSDPTPDRLTQELAMESHVFLDSVCDLIDNVVTTFLTQHHFNPGSSPGKRKRDGSSTAHQSTSRSGLSPSARRIRGAQEPVAGMVAENDHADPRLRAPSFASAQVAIPPTLSRIKSSLNADAPPFQSRLATESGGSSLGGRASALPTVPTSCTGCLVTRRGSAAIEMRENIPLTTATKHFHRLKAVRPVAGKPLPDFLCEWENPVFDPGEASIQQLVPAYANKDAPSNQHHTHRSAFNKSLSSITQELSITREDLACCRVIGQVDRKFILVLTAPPKSTLVIIDQHAADERIRLEVLYDELCNLEYYHMNRASAHFPTEQSRAVGDVITYVNSPLVLQPELLELEELGKRWLQLDEFGINMQLVGTTWVVNTLPSAIAERCISDPRTLLENLRAEAMDDRPAMTKRKETEEHASWLTRLSDCPKFVVEMLKSRACRSAIMFNDELSVEKCEELVRALARTEIPFSCAHGRRSVVPLADLRSKGLGGGIEYGTPGQDGGVEGFEGGFRAWQFDEMLVGEVE